MNDIGPLVEEQKKKLPPLLVESIDASSWNIAVQNIGQENNLNTDQINILERETMLIIYAFEPPEKYVENIIRELQISEEVAVKIAESVWEKIMDPISKRVSEKNSPQTSVPEVAPEIHPVIEPGEVVHTVPHVEQVVPPSPPRAATVPTPPPPKPEQVPPTPPKPQDTQAKPERMKLAEIPKYGSDYPTGKDPYREPLQ